MNLNKSGSELTLFSNVTTTRITPNFTLQNWSIGVRVKGWAFGRCLECVWKVSGRCLEGVWNVSGRCLEGVNFWDLIFSGPKFLQDPNFFLCQIFSLTRSFHDPKFFRTQNFFGPRFFWESNFLGIQIFGTQIFSEHKFFSGHKIF